MSARFSWESLPENLDLQMLQNAQAYLRCLRTHQTPAAGEKYAFDCIYTTYDRLIRSFVRACGVAADDADDCCQEVWQDISMKLAAFRCDGSQTRFCSWLKTICHSKATNLLRYQRRHCTAFLWPHVEAVLASRDVGSLDEYALDWLRDAVDQTIAILRHYLCPLNRRIFEMGCVEGRKPREIATEVGLTRRQVVCRLYHTKRKFRRLWMQVTEENSSKR